MELDDLRALSTADQQTFLIGRVSTETVRMDVSLRFLNGTLRGKKGFDSYLDAPDNFKADARECDGMILAREAPEHETQALLDAVESGREVYNRRNRFVHRFLRTGLVRREQWELAHVSRPRGGAPEVEDVSFDDLTTLVRDIIGVTYKLRAAAMHVATGGHSTWTDLLFSHVEGNWDGSATWTG